MEHQSKNDARDLQHHMDCVVNRDDLCMEQRRHRIGHDFRGRLFWYIWHGSLGDSISVTESRPRPQNANRSREKPIDGTTGARQYGD